MVSVREAVASGVQRDHFFVSEHEGPEGRYYRQSTMMDLEMCRQRARSMVEVEGALSATIGMAVSRVERRFQSVEIDPVQQYAGGMLSAGMGSWAPKQSAADGARD